MNYCNKCGTGIHSTGHICSPQVSDTTKLLEFTVEGHTPRISKERIAEIMDSDTYPRDIVDAQIRALQQSVTMYKSYAEAVGELHKPVLHLETMYICDVCMIVVDGKPNSVRYPCPTAKLFELLKGDGGK